MANSANSVLEYLEQLAHPRKDEIELLRRIILETSPELTEHIKWNAPSFCVNGEDRFTMRIHPPQFLQLIFHRGAKVKAPLTDPLIADPDRLLKWASNDRAIATFASKEDIEAKKSWLQSMLKAWIVALKIESKKE